jgi:hypothetical protein
MGWGNESHLNETMLQDAIVKVTHWKMLEIVDLLLKPGMD